MTNLLSPLVSPVDALIGGVGVGALIGFIFGLSISAGLWISKKENKNG